MFVMNHLVIDMYTCTNLVDITRDMPLFMEELGNVITEAGATILNHSHHIFDVPGAFTCLFLLSESHVSIHTWPELEFAAVDVFTCGSANTFSILLGVQKLLGSKDIEVLRVHRRQEPSDFSMSEDEAELTRVFNAENNDDIRI